MQAGPSGRAGSHPHAPVHRVRHGSLHHIYGVRACVQAAAPSLGIGRIKARDNPALYGTDREYSLRTPDDPFYKRFSAEASRQARRAGSRTAATRGARQAQGTQGCVMPREPAAAVVLGQLLLDAPQSVGCSVSCLNRRPLGWCAFPACRFQICIDVFACGNAYMDLPSLGALPKYTGGQVGRAWCGRFCRGRPAHRWPASTRRARSPANGVHTSPSCLGEPQAALQRPDPASPALHSPPYRLFCCCHPTPPPQLHYFPGFQAERDGAKLHSELWWVPAGALMLQ